MNDFNIMLRETYLETIVDKIKLSLWDVFAFIASSFVLHLAFYINEKFVLGNNFIETRINFSEINFTLIFVGTSYLLFSGMIFEPIVNSIYNLVLKIIKDKKNYDEAEVSDLAEFIKIDIYKRTGFEIKGSPYHYVKDFLNETGKNSLFLAFLSKYGFYRSCAVISLGLILRNIVNYSCISLISCFAYFIVFLLFFRRANMFYYYQAPTLYRTYLMNYNKFDEKI